MSKLQPAVETKIALAIEYAELMDYKKLKSGFKTHKGTKLTIAKIGKLLLELGFVIKVKNRCVLDIHRIYQFNSYLHTKIHPPVRVGEQARLII